MTYDSTYRPRRCSSRWLDADCPKGVLCIMDHPAFADRYTIFYTDVMPDSYGFPWISYRAASAAPFHPQGVGLYCQMEAHKVAAYRYSQKHRYAKWSSLPEDVKHLVRQDLEPES